MAIRRKDNRFHLDHKTYISITDILQSEPGVRNLMIITGKGTGKSNGARKLQKTAVIKKRIDSAKYHGFDKEEEIITTTDPSYVLIDIMFKSGRGKQIRTAGIRNTEKAMKTSVKNKFKAIFTTEDGYKVDDTGVYDTREKDELPIVLFVNLSCPDNYADNNLKCRIIIYDEFNNFDSTGSVLGEKDAIKDFIHTFTDLLQGITRPYDDGEPLLIMLANPRTTPDENDLYDLFNCRGNWDKCNVKDQFIKNKHMKFMGIGTAPFKIKEMEYSLGNVKSVGNDYPKYNSEDKRVYGGKDAVKSFKQTAKENPKNVFGITYKKTDFECCYMNIGARNVIYVHELRNYLEATLQNMKWFVGEWDDKDRDNQLMTKDGIGTSLKNYYKQSSIFYSSGYAKAMIKELSVKVIKAIKE